MRLVFSAGFSLENWLLLSLVSLRYLPNVAFASHLTGEQEPVTEGDHAKKKKFKPLLRPRTAGKGSTGPAHLPMVVFKISGHSAPLFWSSVGPKC